LDLEAAFIAGFVSPTQINLVRDAGIHRGPQAGRSRRFLGKDLKNAFGAHA
jgi:hypothetical protein